MGQSRIGGALGSGAWNWAPARTPGACGVNDQGDPNLCTLMGDAAGPTGWRDGADPTLSWWTPATSAAAPRAVRIAPEAALSLPVMAPQWPAGRPPWMAVAESQALAFGGRTEAVIERTVNFHRELHDGKASLVGNANAWCAAFVNWCLRQAGIEIENPGFADRAAAKARANAFFRIERGNLAKGERARPMIANPLFERLAEPAFGAIGMLTTPGKPEGHGHHVGFVYSRPLPGGVVMLAGNESDRIMFRLFTIDGAAKGADFLMFFAPAGYADVLKGAALGSESAESLNARFRISTRAIKRANELR